MKSQASCFEWAFSKLVANSLVFDEELLTDRNEGEEITAGDLGLSLFAVDCGSFLRNWSMHFVTQ